MTVWALGINHASAPLELRERFAVGLDQLGPALGSLRDRLRSAGPRHAASGTEAAIVSTCNRTEIYGVGDSQAAQPALDWLASQGGIAMPQLASHTYQLHSSHAARHAFRVASGLDSMVLGEPQILGQMKSAVRVAEESGALGQTLNQLFQRSFAVAKAVRSQTDIGAHSVSMAAAAVRLAAQLFEDLRQCRVLFVGAGEMIELAATHFAGRHPQQMVIANRSAERADALAQRMQAQWMPLADLPSRLHEFDVVVSCTASTLPLIGLGAVERALKARRHRPMLMVDLAVPRDIEPEVRGLTDVYLYTVDDLAALVQTAREHRQAAVAQAEAIIDEGVSGFLNWVALRSPAHDHAVVERTGHSTVGVIQQLQAQAENWRQIELARARKRLARGEDVDAVLQALARGLTQKALHPALQALNSTDAAQRESHTQAVAQLFLRDAAAQPSQPTADGDHGL
jgi:glutamyl-tRNA reductase